MLELRNLAGRIDKPFAYARGQVSQFVEAIPQRTAGEVAVFKGFIDVVDALRGVGIALDGNLVTVVVFADNTERFAAVFERPVKRAAFFDGEKVFFSYEL